jgi:hypothetical protein
MQVEVEVVDGNPAPGGTGGSGGGGAGGLGAEPGTVLEHQEH